MIDRVQKLQEALAEGGERIFDRVPAVLRNIMRARTWEARYNKDGNLFSSFETFVVHPLWQGLESSIEDLLDFCRRAPDVQELIKKEITEASDWGGDRRSPNFQGRNTASKRRHPHTKVNLLSRLKRDRPDLAERVVRGELSANKAAIEAGFRKAPRKLPTHCPHCGEKL